MATGNPHAPTKTLPLRIDAPLVAAAPEVGNTRFDTAHVATEKPAQAAAATEHTVDLEAAATLVSQARTHSAQLADYLRAEVTQIDQREAQLNAQAAELESQMRRGRIWLDMRRDELDQRQAELDQREREIDARSAETILPKDGGAAGNPIATERAATVRLREAKVHALEHKLAQAQQRADRLEKREQAIADREQALADLEQRQAARRAEIAGQSFDSDELNRHRAEIAAAHDELDRRQARLVAEERRLAQALAEIETHQSCEELEIDQRAKQFDEVRERLQLADSLLVKQQAECDRQQAVLRTQRELLDREKESIRLHAEETRRQMDEEKAANQTLFAKKQQQLAAQAESLEKVRREVRERQCEALEMRLVTEQVWSQLAAVANPPSLIQSIAKLRGRIADEYQLEQQRLARSEQALRGALGELAGRREQLKSDQQELRDWTRRRQEDLEQQAARLVAREQELEHRERDLNQSETQWRHERRTLEDRTRRLLAGDAAN